MSGTAARSTTAETPLARASLNRWPSSPNPVTSVAHLIPAARACRLASALSVTAGISALNYEYIRGSRISLAVRQAIASWAALFRDGSRFPRNARVGGLSPVHTATSACGMPFAEVPAPAAPGRRPCCPGPTTSSSAAINGSSRCSANSGTGQRQARARACGSAYSDVRVPGDGRSGGAAAAGWHGIVVHGGLRRGDVPQVRAAVHGRPETMREHARGPRPAAQMSPRPTSKAPPTTPAVARTPALPS